LRLRRGKRGMGNFYQEDLAYVHHTGFGDFAEQAGTEILALLQERQIREGLVVDLGCGSGAWARRLLREGYEVLGVDVSAAMVDLARTQASQARIEQASVFDFTLPDCRVITALGEVLGYGLDGLPDDRQLADFFKRAAASLPADGILLFDVIVASPQESLDAQNWRKGVDWAVLSETRELRESGQLSREIVVFREVGGYYRRSEERHLVRVFEVEMLTGLLTDAGFRVTVSDGYGGYRLARRRAAFVARKN